MKSAQQFVFASLVLLGLSFGSNAFASDATKASATAQIASAGSAKSVVAPNYRLRREYILYVLTTESRIPKRYVYRFASELTTGTPLRMYFNNNRLQLLGADLTGLRMR